MKRAAQHKARVIRPAAPAPDMEQHANTVLRIYERAQNYDGLIWITGPTGATDFYARCPNLFRWADEDTEPIGPDDIELLEDCLEKLGPWTGFLSELFAARKRGARPQFMWLAENPAVAKIFEDACPPREYGA